MAWTRSQNSRVAGGSVKRPFASVTVLSSHPRLPAPLPGTDRQGRAERSVRPQSSWYARVRGALFLTAGRWGPPGVHEQRSGWGLCTQGSAARRWAGPTGTCNRTDDPDWATPAQHPPLVGGCVGVERPGKHGRTLPGVTEVFCVCTGVAAALR